MGFFSSLTNSLFGKGGSGTAGEAARIAKQYADQSTFKGFAIRSGLGETTYDPKTGSTLTLSPEMEAAFQGTLGGSEEVLRAFRDFDVGRRAEEITGQQVAMLQPEFERLFSQQATEGFRSGTLGKRLSGQALGLGSDIGPVNVGDVATQRIISQALAPIAAQAQTQALGEYGQLAQLGTGLLGGALGITSAQQSQLGLGGQLEGMRGSSYLAAGNLATSPLLAQAQLQQQNRASNAGFFGGLLSAGIGAYGMMNAPVPPPSDIRLKDNVTYVDTLPNGIKLYTWEWNEQAKTLELDTYPTFGVMAQEIAQVIPDAVIMHTDGYYRVNYSHPELQGVH